MATIPTKEELQKIIIQLEKQIREFPEVYIIQCEELYKIGISHDAWKRMKYLQEIIP
jgi:hypothetical protein